MKPTFFRGVALGAATSVVVLAGTAALAGTGVGDVFNLGQANTVDASSSLQGTVNNNPQLLVSNSGTAAGIRGDSVDGRGILGRHLGATGTDPGVEGDTNSTDPRAFGVVGQVPAGVGTGGAGVRGVNPSTQAGRYGVWGSVAGSGDGVYGQATGGAGVLGEGTTGTGVLGIATTGIGLRGLSTGGRGVQGQNLSATRSVNGDQPGVFGTAFADDGGQFVSSKGTGAWGYSSNVVGLLGVGPGELIPNQVPSVSAGVMGLVNSASAPGVLAQNEGTGPGLKVLTNGGPPLAVNSQVKVANLNADYLDGLSSSNFVQTGCAQGLVHGFARVLGASGFASTYTAAGVTPTFNCNGSAVFARRVSAGVYFVRFVNNGSQLIVGNVINDDNDFLSWNLQLDPLDNLPAFRVTTVSSGNAHEDRAFVVMLM
jgi:hypothetical protein